MPLFNKKFHQSMKIFKGFFYGSSLSRVKRKPPGQSPGTVVHTGDRKLDDLIITVHTYDQTGYRSEVIENIDKSFSITGESSKTWVQVRGLHDIEKLKLIWEYFKLHPLIQEDIVNTSQRPKVEPYEDIVFIVLRLITGKEEVVAADQLKTEQVSILVGTDFVLSFQESDKPVFDPVIRRLAIPGTRLRNQKADYLAYALIDTIVDHYFSALDLISETIETIEDRIIEKALPVHLHAIHALRRDLIFFRKSVLSLRDGINSLIRDDSTIISSEVKIFLRDIYDHIIQVIDSIETHREMLFSLYDMYMSSLSIRMNEIMKVLTIIATIFIPLTFIAGVYGMNFNPEVSFWNMPELNWKWGYPASLVLMASVAGGLLFYFRKKGWI